MNLHFNYQVGECFFIKYSSWRDSLDRIKRAFPDNWSKLWLEGYIVSVDYFAGQAKFSVPCLHKTYRMAFDYFSRNFVKQNLPANGTVLRLAERIIAEGTYLLAKFILSVSPQKFEF